MAKGLNMQSVKTENRTQMLYLLNAYGKLSRKEIAAKLGLTPAAVTKISAQLIEQGVVQESGEFRSSGKSGRKEILLSLCNEDKFVLGINAEGDVITFSICSLSGKLLALETLPFTPDVDDVIFRAKTFAEKHASLLPYLIGCGVCIIGNENEYSVWNDSRLKEKIEAALAVPAVIENNVKAFVEAALLYGKRESSDAALVIKWGPGVGSAIVADGKIYADGDNSMAEIGHYIVSKSGRRCRCGRYGCLETEVSEDAIAKEMNRNEPLDETLKNCDNEVMNILDGKIDLMALAIANTATILNTPVIVFYGNMFRYEFVAERLKRQLLRYNPTFNGERIILSALNNKSAYIGTVAICAKRLFFEKALG